ncbi:MAG: hypothetical protein A2261_02355 [Candidatus Magasanikbacteria bacterium RIFOXYA2_FULL_44_8]|uniref:Uncharacterized protein n=1 Tax=Candidatus Magasanikbacteria bacterium RIFOXYA2_FULL_44_8 TaxID=1798696 RepID=A0A1F6NJ12_9BACT|nr:MAG: hypothetical protein A2261_02355 [Candidatus Magasanikbacteria bacterium RIFOXYA2_FULL_44_8]
MSEPNLVKTKEDKMKDFYLFEELFETLEGRKEYEKLVERSKRKREAIDRAERISWNLRSMKVPCGI